jgi:hypothetical protein
MCEGSHPYIPVDKVVEVRMQYSEPGGVAENVLNFRFTTAITGTILSNLATVLHSWFTTTLAPQKSVQVSLTRMILTDLSTATGPQLVYTTGLPESGTAGFDVMPGNVTLAVSLRSSLRGRSQRGRIYWIGMVDENVIGDRVTTGFQAALLAAHQVLISVVFTDICATLVVVSRCHAHAWRTTGQATPVESITVDRTLDSQRRRLLGRGA